MIRLFLSLLSGALVGFLFNLSRGQRLMSIAWGVAATLITALLSFSKDASEVIKNILEARKTAVEITLKKLELAQATSRIQVPTPAEVKDYGTPLKTQQRSMEGYLRGPSQEVHPKKIIQIAQEIEGSRKQRGDL